MVAGWANCLGRGSHIFASIAITFSDVKETHIWV